MGALGAALGLPFIAPRSSGSGGGGGADGVVTDALIDITLDDGTTSVTTG